MTDAFVSTWWVGDTDTHALKHYTHIHYRDPHVSQDGYASCNTSDIPFINQAHQYNVSVLWGGGLNILGNDTYKANYLQSIGQAVRDCHIDGIEIDYEFQNHVWGIVTPSQSTAYSEFLWKIKQAISPGLVVADIMIWGMAPGNYILGVLPWINASYLNSGKIDYVNTMSYHWNEHGNIWAWEKDIYFLTKIWKYDPQRINLGVPYYTKKQTSWNTLSKHCPNIDPHTNICNDQVFVGKQMNKDIGKLARKHNLRGVFPWCMTYDSYTHNNTLITWLIDGYSHNT